MFGRWTKKYGVDHDSHTNKQIEKRKIRCSRQTILTLFISLRVNFCLPVFIVQTLKRNHVVLSFLSIDYKYRLLTLTHTEHKRSIAKKKNKSKVNNRGEENSKKKEMILFIYLSQLRRVTRLQLFVGKPE